MIFPCTEVIQALACGTREFVTQPGAKRVRAYPRPYVPGGASPGVLSASLKPAIHRKNHAPTLARAG